MKNFFLLIIASALLISCEKGVTFDLDESAPKLVVDATIETNRPPLVSHFTFSNFESLFAYSSELFFVFQSSHGSLTVTVG